MSALLEVSGLSCGYGAGNVLNDVNLLVERGEVVVVLGANGAGKTTMMRALSGVIQRRGSITFATNDISAAPPERIVRLGLAQVPQGRGTIADLTVEDNLRAGALVRKSALLESDLTHWYETYPRLGERRKQKAGLLSGGEQQMLAIARAMMCRPDLLLCDEPSLGLSPKLTQELFASLARLNEDLGMAILVVEQNATLALSIAQRGYLLESGVLAGSRTASDLTSDDSIRAAYLGY